VLGILFVVFVACYLPFFAVYVVKGTCGEPCRPYLPPRVLIALEWVAYSGSMLNPIIYHVFNPDFRRAFETLLRCGCCRPATAASRQRQAASFAAGRATSAAARRTAAAARGAGVPATGIYRQSAVDIPICRVDAVWSTKRLSRLALGLHIPVLCCIWVVFQQHVQVGLLAPALMLRLSLAGVEKMVF